MDLKDYILLISASLSIVFIVGWVTRKYFSVNAEKLLTEKSNQSVAQLNTQQITKHTAQQVSRTQGDGASGATLTESNNALSQQAFDGINLNPEKIGKLATSDNTSDKEKLPDLANESVLSQGRQSQHKINSQGE